ncbi:MAG: phenylalanine--tRNA ligase subunit beta, partial [Oscillospiraceae bacterium]|nr:phenylalanine--tRNA ligase subunit beta [Oscillospiraceae bacterium]
PLGTIPAVQRACQLVELLGAGEVVDGVIDVIASDSAPTKLLLEPDKVNRLLGTDIDKPFMKKVLEDLGFTFEGDVITVPSWRGDVVHYSDVAEEVARFYGYDAIEPSSFSGSAAEGGLTDAQQAERSVRALCRDMGFSEILTYSFMGQSDYDMCAMPADHPLRRSFTIQNPLGEDSSVMRTFMLPSLMQCLARNYSYRSQNVRLFDLGKVYLPGDGELALERNTLALGAYGSDTDFYSLKGSVEAVLRYFRIRGAVFEAESGHFAYHPGRCAAVRLEDTLLGVFGELHPSVAKNYGINERVYAAELDFDALFACRGAEPTYVPLPRFPAVLRDLAVVCSADVTVGRLEQCILEGAGPLLRDVKFFDVYTGAPIPPGKKSVAFSLCFRADDRSLADGDIEPEMTAVLAALESRLGAKIR